LLVSASLIEDGDTVAIVTAKGQSIRFQDSDVREMGRNAGGVRVIKLSKGDHVIGAQVAHKSAEKPMLLVISANGYGKKTDLEEYKIQNRGGSGIKTGNVTAKTGAIISSAIVTPLEEEIVAISKKGQVIRTSIAEIPKLKCVIQDLCFQTLLEQKNQLRL
jgi:DNA gyrase subunit A